ncbi:tyrosine-type recombinase/integrase [Streptomyces sp. NPDC060366]|uniref:tyrosine-type recombinase/integrase n=1 Tax=Streptomyces sp. NPDC060366 TaxID=3347105 RepID=UPI0036614583
MNDIEPAAGREPEPVTDARTALVTRWAERHGVEAAARLAQAEDLADAVAAEIRPANTDDTYTKSWRVWERFCAAQRFPTTEGSRGALVAYVAWLLREGRQRPGPGGVLGYAPASARLHLDAAIVGLRNPKAVGRAGAPCPVTKDDAAEARVALDGLEVKLIKAKERRGRGQAVAADPDGLYAIAAACDTSLEGRRDLALILTGFHYASRASEPAGLLNADVAVRPKGLVISVLTGKTKHSVRSPKIPYASDLAICPVRAWIAYREALVAHGGSAHSSPTDSAFHWIDQHGNIRGPLGPDGVTEAIKRIAARAGIPVKWTGHSLRSGLASTGRKRGKDAVAIADQGGWARHSRSMLGYMQRDEGWDDNASAGLT